jgi:hypothetical protein
LGSASEEKQGCERESIVLAEGFDFAHGAAGLINQLLRIPKQALPRRQIISPVSLTLERHHQFAYFFQALWSILGRKDGLERTMIEGAVDPFI